MHVLDSGALRANSASLGRPRSVKWLSLLGAVVMLFAIQGGSAESARADGCVPNEGNWLCHWQDNIAPYQNRWLNLPNPLRNWFKAGVGDLHGGTVAAKCVNIMRSSDNAAISVACGPGFPVNPIGAPWKPGYLYIMQWAAGARSITGAGSSP